MKGCTFKRRYPSGKTVWGFSVDAGRDPTGKRIRIFESGFRLEKEADKALREKLREIDAGNPTRRDPGTFAEFLGVCRR